MEAGLPANAQVFALTSIEGQLFAGLYAKGLYGWSESEEKWTQVGGAAGIKPLALAVSDGVLIAGHNPGGIYWSGDRGGSWQRWSPLEEGGNASTFDSILTGVAESAKMKELPVIEAPIWEMAADWKLAIAGASDGIYLSKDLGRTWTRATSGLPAHGPGIAFHIGKGVIFAAVHLKDASCEAAGRK